MGGYVSMVASASIDCEAVFMLAPALYMPGYAQQTYLSKAKRICTVHGNNDEIIPYQHSQKYADASNTELYIIDGDHRLKESLNEVSDIFNAFLAKIRTK
jgi:predicted esterase